MEKSLNSELIGAVIGLVRATEGNEELVNDYTNSLIIVGLNNLYNGINTEELIRKMHEEKKRIIPSCFICKAPCGRNDDYDINELIDSPINIRKLKMEIIDTLVTKNNYFKITTIYKSLFFIGLNISDEKDLENIIQELNNELDIN